MGTVFHAVIGGLHQVDFPYEAFPEK